MTRISDQLEISFDTNEIITMAEDDSISKIKVEPRIMHVLQILINNSPDVVSREKLITEVWDNYGGADDALNQAVSHLRKMLNDTDKENRIIETVIKKGYRINHRLDDISEDQGVLNKITRKLKTWIVIAILLTGFIVFITYTIQNKEKRKTTVPEAPIDKGNNTNNDESFAPEADEPEKN